MKHSYFTAFVIIVGSLAFLLATSLPSVAASFSGRVVDEDGQPVEGLIIALPSFPGNTPPDPRHRVRVELPDQFEAMFPPAAPSETDATGAFSIRNIATPSVSRLTLFPERNSDYEMLSVEIEGIRVYLDQRQHFFGGLNFAIAPETDIENVEVTVRLRMRIRGRVLSADGTPLRNVGVQLGVRRRDIEGRGRGSSSGSATLDEDGYFVEYVNEAAYYTVTVSHQGQSVQSEEILLEDGQRLDGLVLTFGDKPRAPRPERIMVRRPQVHDPARFEAAQVPLGPPSGISGKVIDPEGNAIAGFMFTIQPMQLRDGHLQPGGVFLNPFQQPPEGVDGPGMPRATVPVETDSDGTFTATNIQPGLVQLNVIPGATLDAFEKIDPEKIRQGEQVPPKMLRPGSLEPDKRIISIEVGKSTFFNHTEMRGPAFFGGLTFGLKPGVVLRNVEITVKSRMQIRGRIIYADGTPLADTEGRIRTRWRDEASANHRSSSSAYFFSDADGHFTLYRDEPGYYTLSFEHKGLSAGAGPFLVKDGVAPENLILTLDGNPPKVERPADQKIGD